MPRVFNVVRLFVLKITVNFFFRRVKVCRAGFAKSQTNSFLVAGSLLTETKRMKESGRLFTTQPERTEQKKKTACSKDAKRPNDLRLAKNKWCHVRTPFLLLGVCPNSALCESRIFVRLSLAEICLQCMSQLIWTGCGFWSALNAFNAFNDVLCFLSANQSADSFQITVASADELYIFDDVAVHFQNNVAGTGSFGMVLKDMSIIPSQKDMLTNLF